ncbi:copper transporter [Hoyosella sp. YIM 151337]|uniref:copper transporter n=1 Tax=Hoyosella sp. YIM 151337 TaxID=2992742 RepID=UPI0022355EC3|nr:copper transporter [Hoyosella sp. YIM 151337]MCW4353992.1 copper transporter [Hoyosella sp. YIM 151337]
MIPLRYHAVSLVAVFLALALGLVLGSTALADRVVSNLRSDSSELSGQAKALAAERDSVQQDLDALEALADVHADQILAGELREQPVIVMAAPGANPEIVAGVRDTLARAGAPVHGTVSLTPAFTDVSEAERLRGLITNSLPAGAELNTGATDQGSMTGDLLGAAFLHAPGEEALGNDDERNVIVDVLSTGGFLSVEGSLSPAVSAVVVTSVVPDSDGNDGAFVARFAAGLAGHGAVVAAGEAGTAEGNSAVAVIRAENSLTSAVSTVDNADAAAGRITVALALAERVRGTVGHYGMGPKASAPTRGA